MEGIDLFDKILVFVKILVFRQDFVSRQKKKKEGEKTFNPLKCKCKLIALRNKNLDRLHNWSRDSKSKKSFD
jgi:hypothetical protein